MTRPLRIRAFRPHLKGIKRALGELESQVMESLWQAPHSSVKDIWERLSQKRSLAYTTVMTTMDRLYQKGLLQRVKAGKAFLYAPRFSRQQFEEILTTEVLRGLATGTREPLISAFLDLLSEIDPKSLDRLGEMIRKRRTGNE
ncbi:MAG: BlaI/MecI/CopY family transcriptional regulator [candidate division NC10 bacterium]|nr:BlaI/MecI/CopY family transcriptional regulator [candidate division NC10 bacterium]